MPTTPCFFVDAFAGAPFRGNPAAVCLLASSRSTRWLQAVAAEINLSETAFVSPATNGFRLRWFTPTVEVDLCGHATLASAHVLWTEGVVPRQQPIGFRTRSGLLTCRADGDRIELDFPARPVREMAAPAALLRSLPARPHFVGRNVDDWLVELASPKAVRALRPDLATLATVPARGVIVTARGERGCDFVSRFFGPAVGVPEDPVTGSAHCALGPFWAKRLGRTRLVGHQVSARGGVVGVDVRDERVGLLGQAVTVMRGELLA